MIKSYYINCVKLFLLTFLFFCLLKIEFNVINNIINNKFDAICYSLVYSYDKRKEWGTLSRGELWIHLSVNFPKFFY